ncbi:stealth conserved region 3 domain-containing protein [Planktotalea sp.]|uniref:stealth conserved region 3 domain-containing protein n=1 Tax=Planktotalea sp. TaxID=2029877 RepID=UPI003D6BFACD
MNHSRSWPNADAPATIPEFPEIQRHLLQNFLTACHAHKVKPQLVDCYETPNLGFEIVSNENTLRALASLLADGFQITSATTKQALGEASLESVALPARLVLFSPILIDARMIHGSSSGIEMTLTDTLSKGRKIKFPNDLFDGLAANAYLTGQTLRASKTLLSGLKKSKIPTKLDIVYTWVDDTDPVWSEKRRQYNPANPSADAEDKSRFQSNDELLYSLRSLFRYFSGIGKVYLVTDGQTPHFIEEFEGRVSLVNHADIMGTDVERPTFNSHVIESCLHHIKGLSEQYLYLNDDFLFARPTCPADFFDAKGRSKVFYSNKAYIPKGSITDKTLAVDAAAINQRKLLAKRFNHQITRKFQHTPVAIHKDVMFTMEELFAKEFSRLRKNRFRSRTDISPSGSFYAHYAVMIDRAVPSKIKYRYYDTAAPRLVLKLMKLSYESAELRPKVHCINSTGDRAMSGSTARGMQRQLTALYPSARSKSAQNTMLDKLRYRATQKVLNFRKQLRRKLRKRN